ncbi:response regulator transcription factor [Seonamhaeicola marinus]|uniref:Response regulator transcription factor n=1 Tax=Seonamhaeicola marinus TaxID=1912246 RepID=A0A5D0HVB6_9FLAO|nr:response regulator transcription factor [Seonamhaeicola marinus]TYA74429.1 response regulator transcription factor [Seonamhaeicola marinus]
MKPIKVLIVDDSKIFAQGLKSLLKQYPDYVSKICLAHNYEKALDKLEKEDIDFVILDLNFESEDYNGFDIARKVKSFYPSKKVIILTQQAKIENYNVLFKDIKVDGYLDKQLGVEETLEALETIYKGGTYIDSNINAMLEIGMWFDVSKRQREIIDLISSGLTQKEVAVKLFISNRTVETHIKNLAKKMEAKNTAHLISIYTKYINGNREGNSNT